MTNSQPSFKSTGVDFLGDIPDHWEVLRLKYRASYRTSNVDKKTKEGELPVRLCNYTDVYYRDRIRAGDGSFMKATASPQEIVQFKLNEGDVVITKDSEDWQDIAVPAFIEETADDFVCGYHLGIIRPTPLADPGFVFRSMQSIAVNCQLQVAATGITRFGLPKPAVGEALVPFPPHDEQRAIADYLDTETARIDTLISKKRRLIELLAEYRTALISQTVTRGLDPSARLCPSGIDWLGDIPAHWEARRLKDVGTLVGGAGFPEALQGMEGEELPFFKVGDLSKARDGLWLTNSGHTISRETATSLRAQVIPKGAIAYAKIGAALLLNRRRIVAQPSCIDNNLSAYIPDANRITTGWALYTLSLIDFGLHVNPGAVPSLSEGDQSFLPIAIPPVAEQRAIADYLNTESARIDALSPRVAAVIKLLEEYRTALITAAVTGHLATPAPGDRNANGPAYLSLNLT